MKLKKMTGSLMSSQTQSWQHHTQIYDYFLFGKGRVIRFETAF